MRNLIKFVKGPVQIDKICLSQDDIDATITQLNGVDSWYDMGTVPAMDPLVRLEMDIDFGKQLIKTFLQDNRLASGITPADSISLMTKFADVEKLADKGDITTVLYLMQNISVDTIFTQERKDKYLNMIAMHRLNVQ